MLKLSSSLVGAFALVLGLNSCGDGATKTATDAPAAGAKAPAELDIEKHYPNANEFEDVDLSSYGSPVVVKAPKGARVLKDTITHRLTVYGGKYFQCSVTPNAGSFESVDGFFNTLKANTKDKEMAPDFSKYLVQEPLALLIENKGEGTSNMFHVVVPGRSKNDFYILTEGMTIDINPDGNTDFTPADVKTMFEAAKMAHLK